MYAMEVGTFLVLIGIVLIWMFSAKLFGWVGKKTTEFKPFKEDVVEAEPVKKEEVNNESQIK